MNEKWIKVSQDNVYIRADRIDAVRIAENAVQGYDKEPTVYYRLQALVGGEWITVNSYRSGAKYINDYGGENTAEYAAKNDRRALMHAVTAIIENYNCDYEFSIRKDDEA